MIIYLSCIIAIYKEFCEWLLSNTGLILCWQTLSFCALMMSIIHAIVKGSSNLGKKKKKREGKSDQSDVMVSL